MNGELILVGGGARSGKSSFALRLAEERNAPRYFIATGQAFDAEMQERIDRHRRERAERFSTMEAPRQVAEAIGQVPAQAVVIIDCITLWISNILLAGEDEDTLLREADGLVHAVRQSGATCIAVTNEVGSGIVPESPLGRQFRDVAGRMNQKLAAEADQVYLATMGCVLKLKPILERVSPN